jgi:hypothetical protein
MKRKLTANLQFNFKEVDGDTVKQINDFHKWLQSEQSNLAESENKKEYDSLVRARAFCLALLQESGKENFLDGNKLMQNKIKGFTERTWKGQSGHTVYVECINIMSSKNPINSAYKEEHPLDFNFGKVLFDELVS